MCERKAKQFSFHLHIIPSQDRNADTKQSKEKKISMQQRINFASHCWDKWNAFINCLTFKKERAEKSWLFSPPPRRKDINNVGKPWQSDIFLEIHRCFSFCKSFITIPCSIFSIPPSAEMTHLRIMASKLTLFREQDNHPEMSS
jgi:hypothetical protein